MEEARSYLFVPADRPERFTKALSSGAGRVVIDLEDAVATAAKETARETLRSWLQAAPAGTVVCVRVNGTMTDWHDADMSLAALPAVDGIMLPKADGGAMAGQVRARMRDEQNLIALVETVGGILALRDLVCSGAVARVAFGSVDFCVDAGMRDTAGALDAVRTMLVLESRHAGLPPPIDGVSTSLDDATQIRAEVDRARALGFGAKLCIHPAQVAPVNAGFLPSADELAWASRVLDAMQSAGHGAIAVDGKLVDKPLVDLARRIVALAADASPQAA